MGRSSGDFAGKDISSALAGWRFRPGEVNVRIIRGKDGKPKIQLRLDLGLLQMEVNGRPDGKRPHNSVTELHYQARRLMEHLKNSGSESGFTLERSACEALREESAMFYHRYLSLFVLEQFDAVIRDTQHNLDVLDLCRRFATNDHDRTILEQYRPYIVMMQGRSRACRALKEGFPKTALAYLKGTLKRVLALYTRPAGRRSYEAQVLLGMIRQIRRRLPADPMVDLKRRLSQALATEHYEEAAALRDQLVAIETVRAGLAEAEDSGNLAVPDAPTAPVEVPARAKRASKAVSPSRRRVSPRRDRRTDEASTQPKRTVRKQPPPSEEPPAQSAV